MARESLSASDQYFDENIPACPVCTHTANVRLYGRQDYLVGQGKVPSLIFRCRTCDFNFRRFDRPLAEVVSHFKVAPYSTDEVEQRWRRKRQGFYYYLLDQLKQPTEGKTLLDVGCAFGHFLDCAGQRGFKPLGTEVSEELADLSRRRRDYPVSVRPLDDLQLPEERFDVITFIDSFYYFEDPLATLHSCRKLLKPGGQLLMRITNRNGMARLHRLSCALRFKLKTLPIIPYWATDDAISCHSRSSLIKLMKATGFRIKKLTSQERGKKLESFGMRAFYRLTNVLALVTCERICYSPGLVCLAEVE